MEEELSLNKGVFTLQDGMRRNGEADARKVEANGKPLDKKQKRLKFESMLTSKSKC